MLFQDQGIAKLNRYKIIDLFADFAEKITAL